MAISFFKKIYDLDADYDSLELQGQFWEKYDSVIPKLNSSQIFHLQKPFTEFEILDALFKMHPVKTLGPNGCPLDFSKSIGLLWVVISLR